MQVSSQLQPWAEASPDWLRTVRGIFFDIDDTFSSAGKISHEAYTALWQAHDAGLLLVPVTGRPGAWADHIARMWPVDGVVAENGAMATFMRDGALHNTYLLDADARADNRRRLNLVKQEILAQIPGAGLASDQDYRLFDLAIDFCEDVEPLAQAEIEQIVKIFQQHGATAKVSSIHVNGWFGDYDKLGMCRRFAQDILNIDLEKGNKDFVFIGDSPNDAPMFKFFENAVGVANLRDSPGAVDHWPRYITQAYSGAGFVELVQSLLTARQ